MRVSAARRSLVSAVGHGPRLLALATVACVLVAGAITLKGDIFGDPVPVGGGKDSKCWRSKKTERGFAKKMNKARRRSGRRKMSLDPELSKVARVHTREMVRKNTLYHTASNALRTRVVGWNTLGENVGVGNTVRSLHKAFMNSASHRHNILYSTFKHSGIGVKKAHGRMWVTVVFEATKNPNTRLKMPRC
ncbi:MAG: CAP domain-containing protein [Actinomycetota bacterium]